MRYQPPFRILLGCRKMCVVLLYLPPVAPCMLLTFRFHSVPLLRYRTQLDEDALKAELDELEQETLDEQLGEAHPVPMHSPGAKTPAARLPSAPTGQPSRSQEEEDEDRELKELQAALAM